MTALHASSLSTPFDASEAPDYHSTDELAALALLYARRRRKVLLQAQFDPEQRWLAGWGAMSITRPG